MRTNLSRAKETVGARLMETYNWLIVPEQPDPTGPVQFQAYRISGADSIFTRAARKLRQSGMLITEWAPTMLNMELERFLWRDQPHVKLKQVWDDLARYCYLPRLFNQDVLLDAVRAGISAADAPFAYADALDGQGRYQRLLYRSAGNIYLNDAALLVRGEAAQAQLDGEAAAVPAPAGGGVGNPGPMSNGGPTQEGDPTPKPVPAPLKRRYYGTVSLNPQRVNRDIDTIVQEVIE
ncbi:MAG: hypothetical protein KDE20_19315, partial [Caldilineaceae bacterium]|nr:hypothetical protein [Caldilineaceae bacterium]